MASFDPAHVQRWQTLEIPSVSTKRSFGTISESSNRLDTAFMRELKAMRKRKGLTQNELSRRAGKLCGTGSDHTYIGRIESGSRGTPTRKYIDAIVVVAKLNQREADALYHAAGLIPSRKWDEREGLC